MSSKRVSEGAQAIAMPCRRVQEGKVESPQLTRLEARRAALPKAIRQTNKSFKQTLRELSAAVCTCVCVCEREREKGRERERERKEKATYDADGNHRLNILHSIPSA